MPIERADSIIDLKKIDKEVFAFLGYIEKAKGGLIDLFTATKNFKASSIAELTVNTEKLSVSMQGSLQTSKQVTEQNDKLVKSVQELIAATKKQTEAKKETNEQFAKSKYHNDQEISDSVKARQVLKERTDAIRAQGSAYKQLVLEQKQAEQKAKDLAAAFGVHSKEARTAIAHSKELSEKIQGINKASGDAHSGVGRYTEGIKEFAKHALEALGVAELLHKAFEFVKESVEEFIKAQAASSRLANILDNLGRKDILAELNEQAEHLAESLGTVAKKDVTETFQRLITYGKLTKNQILELTPVIVDFAAKQGITLPEATDVLTKAFEGNARGLKQYGINIKEGSNTTERFAIVMDQLKPKVDGAAKAFGETLGGSIKKSEIAVEELKVSIGEKFAPAITKLEEAILTGVKGLPELFQSYINAFKGVWESAKVAYYNIKALFGSQESLLGYEREKKAEEELKHGIEARAQAREVAESNRREAEKNRTEQTDEYNKKLVEQYAVEHHIAVNKIHDQKVLKELREEAEKKADANQEQQLRGQESLMRHSVEYYKQLEKEGKLKTEEGKRAKDQAYTDILVVDGLRKQLAASRDKSIIGFGDPDATTKKEGVTKQKKDLEDYAAAFKKIFEDINQFNQKSLGIDTTPMQKELNQAFIEYSKFFESINDLREKDLKDIEDNLKNGDITGAQAAAQRLTVIENSDRALAQAEYALQNNIAAIREKFRKEEEAKRKAQDEKNFAAAIANAKRIEDELKKRAEKFFSDATLHAQADIARPGGDTHANRKTLIQKETEEEIFGLNQKYSTELRSGQDYIDESDIIKAKSRKRNEDEDRNAAEQAVARVVEVIGKGEEILSGLQKLRTQTQLNELQKVEDAQQQNYENQVKRINNSTLSEVNKAARLQQLEAQRQVQEDQNNRKKRQIAQEEARFEKAKSIVSIILNIAAGVAKAIPNPIEIALAIGVGAVQLAIAAATPIPAYKKGIYGDKYHPGGLALMGEEYKPELVVEPNKKPYWTPAYPHVTNLAKYTQVLPASKVEQMRQGSMRVNPYGHLTGDVQSDIVAEVRGLKDTMLWQTDEFKRAIRNSSKPPVVNIKVDKDWTAYIDKYVNGKR